MMSEIIEQIKILEKKGFTKDQAIQIITTNELKYIGMKLNELSNKG